MKGKKIIKVKTRKGDGKKIAKLYNVTPEFVSVCVNGKSNTSLAKKIRTVAVEMGGDPIYN